MRIRQFLVRQYNFGPWLGGLKDLFSRTTLYISIINFILIAITAYEVTLKSLILQYVPWMSFWVYFLTLVAIVLLVMVLEFKFIVPSHYTFINKQEYEHQSLYAKDLKEIKERLKMIEEKLDADRNNNSNKTT